MEQRVFNIEKAEIYVNLPSSENEVHLSQKLKESQQHVLSLQHKLLEKGEINVTEAIETLHGLKAYVANQPTAGAPNTVMLSQAPLQHVNHYLDQIIGLLGGEVSTDGD